MLRQNLIKNCDVTEKYITLTENMFWRDVPTLKGKSTRTKPRGVVDEEVEIPEEFVSKNRDLELVMDIVYKKSEAILTTVERSVMFKDCIPLSSWDDDEIYKGSAVVLWHYHKGKYTTKKIHADGEFEILLLRIKDELDIEVNITNPEEHVGDIERPNRKIQEKFRKFYRLPFKEIPKVIINSLACVTTNVMNLFPGKGSVSNYISPHVILGKRKLDYKRDFEDEFVEYVEASHVKSPGNNNLTRTLSSIYLMPSESM